MTARVLVPLLAIALAGCALIGPAPPAAPAPAPPGAATPPPTPRPRLPAPEPPREAAPAKEPAVPPLPVTKELSPSPPELTPTLSGAEEARITRETQGRIQTAEQLVNQIDQARLTGAQRETLSTVRSFIAKARLALTSRDLEEAANLSEKARVLADELLRAIR